MAHLHVHYFVCSGGLSGLLKRSFGSPKAFPKYKRRSVVRLPSREPHSDHSKNDQSANESISNKDDTSLNSSSSEAVNHDTVKTSAAQGPLRLFTDNPTWYLDDAFYGSRFEYICSQPDYQGDYELEHGGGESVSIIFGYPFLTHDST